MHEVGFASSSSGQLSFLTFDNSVSEELLCAFELLKPLDGPALRKEMTKAKRKRYASILWAVDDVTEHVTSMMATTT